MSLFERFLNVIRIGDDDYDDDDYDEDDDLEEDDEEEDFEEERPSKLFNMKFRKKSRDEVEEDNEEEDEEDEEEDDEEVEEKPRRSFFPFGSRKKTSREEEEDEEDDEEEEDEEEEEEEPPRSARRSSERRSSAKQRERKQRARRDNTASRQFNSGYSQAGQSSYSSAGQSSYSSAGQSSYSQNMYSSTGTGYKTEDIDWSSFVTQKPGKKPRPQRKRNTGARVRVEVIVPKSMEDTQDIAELLMSDAAVILNLEFIDVDTARRIVDFSCGACYALDGGVQQVSNYVYILTPVNVEVSGDFTSMFSNFFDFADKRSVY